MATMNKITEVLAAIKTLYPYYGRETGVEQTVRLWHTVLFPYDDEEVEKALYLCLQSCKYPPSPADISEAVRSFRESSEPTPEELWSEYSEALLKAARLVSCFNYTAVDENGLTQGQNARNKCNEIFESLSPDVKRYIGSYGEFVRRGLENFYGESSKHERERFVRRMSQLKESALYRDRDMLSYRNSAESLGYYD